MQRVYLNTSIFIFVILIAIQWGFYQSYTSHFPHFKNATTLIHIHGALLMTWMLLLIGQPLLIHSGKASLHRTIGKVSWVLGPLIIISLFLIGRGGYFRGLGNVPEQENLTFIVLDMRGFLSFAIFWFLAMINRKLPDSHMRYMIATGILAIGPGVGRGLGHSFGLDLGTAITITDVLDLAIVGLLLGVDVYRKKNYKPFLTVFVVLLIGSVLWQYGILVAGKRLLKTMWNCFINDISSDVRVGLLARRNPQLIQVALLPVLQCPKFGNLGQRSFII